jgi:hypothetical protein
MGSSLNRARPVRNTEEVVNGTQIGRIEKRWTGGGEISGSLIGAKIPDNFRLRSFHPPDGALSF